MYKYLQSLEKFGINLGLKRITHLLDRLENPQLKFKSIHIAGTNGKGSTAAMTASILKEAGYKVGLYTSPHILDYTERIKINGKDISGSELEEGLRRVKRASEGLKKGKKAEPTIFEVLTAVAFWYFAKKKVDVAVVEVGLGGRLDATNVLNPLVSIITNIDLEHTEVLGRTLAKIAKEKAAIIKPAVPVVTAETKPEPLRVIRKAAEKAGSLLVQAKGYDSKTIPNLAGEHQKLNAACAVSAVRLAGINVTRSQIVSGLRKTEWPGRFQVISRKPLIIMDGAHNPAGAKALKVTIQQRFPGKYTVIYGCQKTKDFKKFLQELKPIIGQLIITSSSHNQAADPRAIARWANSQMPVHLAHTVGVAVLRWDGKSPLLITGSLYLVADVFKLLSA
ncbi:MAG: bifunctional folylpolyglutamate synthase/dihydrofolate synthase [Candidatus Margulisbacteria bacterium]|nr:bifunctional folylpolyglutamate synthase/dihydrofolate synthase [Candidatus Margulisiibacteriota bacterium]